MKRLAIITRVTLTMGLAACGSDATSTATNVQESG